jgi:methionine-gamma-lyase
VYGRTRNPTQSLFEERVASLESAEAGLAVASGMAAISSTLWTLLQARDQVVIDHTLYGNSFVLFVRGLTRFGVKVVVADFTDLGAVEAAIGLGAPKLVFFESPANPNLRIIDIAAVSRIAHQAVRHARIAAAHPPGRRPRRAFGDQVHRRALRPYRRRRGGTKSIVEMIRRHGLRCLTGATIVPLTAFLLLRGLKTLELRMERHCSSALTIAELLEQHRAVTWVSYPGLAHSPFHQLARRQMAAFGGLVACELLGGKKDGMAFMNRLSLVTRAVSLGDAETLVQHPASMTHSTYTEEERQKHGISDGLIRFSIGLETLQI